MDRVILLITYFMVILTSASCASIGRDECETGKCIVITSCPSALKLLKEKNHHKLRKTICGFEDKYSKVCCSSPDDNDRISFDKIEYATRRTQTTTAKTFDTTTRQPSTSAPSGPFPNRTNCGRYAISLPNRISGGPIADITDFPWLARIMYSKSTTKKFVNAFCSASLITDRYLVTAAHCVQNRGQIKAVSVRLGEWDLETEKDCHKNICNNKPVDINISKIIIHPLFNGVNQANDIALIQLAESVKFTDFIQPVCLPTTEYVQGEDYVDGSSYWAAGWGVTEFGTTSSIKRKVQLEAVPIEICKRILPYIRDPTTVICAGGRMGIDTCQGDSGGSLVREVMEEHQVNWYLLGVTSFGDTACGVEGKPGVYTRITPFMDWIRESVST